ncbi:MAG: AraC family transcriptional regulator [Gemmatimonadota bacterium]|nr:AraC family transcriptional regulator [Gemmatimonadota bacterium]
MRVDRGVGQGPIAQLPRHGESPFRYAERVPSDSIALGVLSLWSFRVEGIPDPAAPYTVFPDGCTSVAIARNGGASPMLVCRGPSLTAARPNVLPGARYLGFRLWPDASALVTGAPARALRDYIGPAQGVLAERFAGLEREVPDWSDDHHAFAALDRALVRRLAPLGPPDPRVRAAVRAIVAGRGEVRMDAVACSAGIGLRQLQRRFPAATGLTLREFARVRRLREALGQRVSAAQTGWSRIAAGSGFVDHAHLTREFVALTGIQPSLAALQLGLTDHEDVRP